MSRIAEALDPQAYGATYPERPGFKRTDTSRAAARSMGGSARATQFRILRLLEDRRGRDGLTADEAAVLLNESVLAIRPRFSELRLQEKIVDTKQRRANSSGKKAIVWGLA